MQSNDFSPDVCTDNAFIHFANGRNNCKKQKNFHHQLAVFLVVRGIDIRLLMNHKRQESK